MFINCKTIRKKSIHQHQFSPFLLIEKANFPLFVHGTMESSHGQSVAFFAAEALSRISRFTFIEATHAVFCHICKGSNDDYENDLKMRPLFLLGHANILFACKTLWCRCIQSSLSPS